MTRYQYCQDVGIGIVQAQMLVSVLVSTIKISSIVIAVGPELGIGIDIKNKNIWYWNRYWYC